MEDGFRVQTVAIEGFKGFTSRQVIDFQGRHAFLLGKNGNGKSSIVEAIRWMRWTQLPGQSIQPLLVDGLDLLT